MQCPFCGYDSIADEASFCPQCRYQFREPEQDVTFDTPPSYTARSKSGRKPSGEKFSKKELVELEVRLLGPAVLLMLALAMVFYFSSGRIVELTVPLASEEIRIGGLLSLFVGAVFAWIFYRFMLYRVQS
jgi:hypothetical protein